MKNPSISSAWSRNKVLLFGCLLAACRESGASYTQISLGKSTRIATNVAGSTSIWHSDPPAAPQALRVKNVGQVPVWARLYWKDSWPLTTVDHYCDDSCHQHGFARNGSSNFWQALQPEPVVVEPGHSAVIRTPANATFYFTRLLVANEAKKGKANKSAEVVVEDVFDEVGAGLAQHGPLATPNSTEVLKRTFEWSLSKIPAQLKRTGLGALIDLVWPEKRPSVWNENADKIRYLIDAAVFTPLNELLEQRMRQLKIDLEELATQITKNHSDAHLRYMSIAQDLVGLEQKFVIVGDYNAKNYNKDLLPLYSNVVQLKAGFYGFGTKCGAKINLTKQNVADLRRYFNDTINHADTGAIKHITDILREQAGLAAGNEFDRQMYVQNELQKFGYTRIWSNMLDHAGKRLTNEITYSYLAGNSTAASVDHARLQPKEPLTPPVANGSYSQLIKLVMHIGNGYCVCGHCLVGFQLYFDNGATYQLGELSTAHCTLSPLSSYYRITELTVWVVEDADNVTARNGIISVELPYDLVRRDKPNRFGCKSSLATRRVLSAGPNHYIASIFASGQPSFALPLQNIAVSYLPVSSQVDGIMDEKNWQDWTC